MSEQSYRDRLTGFEGGYIPYDEASVENGILLSFLHFFDGIRRIEEGWHGFID